MHLTHTEVLQRQEMTSQEREKWDSFLEFQQDKLHQVHADFVHDSRFQDISWFYFFKEMKRYAEERADFYEEDHQGTVLPEEEEEYLVARLHSLLKDFPWPSVSSREFWESVKFHAQDNLNNLKKK